jgi:GWxTD domain-containing protein
MATTGRRAILVILALLAVGPPGAGAARSAPTRAEAARLAELDAEQRRWFEDVELLLSSDERATFLALREDYQRDAFIANFWRARDPYPETARNEFRDKWQAKVDEARALFETLADERARFYLLNGPPDARIEIAQQDPRGEGSRCRGLIVPAEVWFYGTEGRLRQELLSGTPASGSRG